MNLITITGNVGKDSELKHLQSGTAILSFSLAVERGYQKDKSNKVSDWFNVTIFGKFAEVMANHIKKGTKVLVSGEMQLTYDKEKMKTYTNINADKVEILKWANDSSDKEIKESDFAAVDEMDQDIPF